MIQQFKIATNSLWKLKDKYTYISLILFAFILSLLLYKYHLIKDEEIYQLLNNTFQFSGIFSAILITFIVSKVIQIRQEKLEKRKEIVILANQTTDFRRIARILQNNWGFWNHDMKSKLDNEYKQLDIFTLELWDYNNENKQPELKKLREDFLKEKNMPGAYLYLEIRGLVLNNYRSWNLELYNDYDYNYSYSLEIITKWSESYCGNRFWRCFDYEWEEYKDCFDFSAISPQEELEILNLSKKINPQKYNNFGKNLLAKVGSEFNGLILTRLNELTLYNASGIPQSLNFLLNILIITIISGVLIPLILTSIKINMELLLITSNFSLIILCLSIFYFLIKFKKILNLEIKL